MRPPWYLPLLLCPIAVAWASEGNDCRPGEHCHSRHRLGGLPGEATPEGGWLQVPGDGSNQTGIITFAGKDNAVHIDAAVMLGLSLFQHLPETPRFCLVVRGIQPTYKRLLEHAHWVLVEVDDWHAKQNQSFMRGYYYNSYNKINVFRVHWPQLLYLDADTFVLDSRLGELAHRYWLPWDRIGMVKDCCMDGFEAGMFLFRPDVRTYRTLQEDMENHTGWRALARQAIAKEFEGRIETLRPLWNVHGQSKDQCDSAVVAHFTGPGKPTTPEPRILRKLRDGSGSEFVNTLQCPGILQLYYRRLNENALYLSSELRWALTLVNSSSEYDGEELERRSRGRDPDSSGQNPAWIEEESFHDFVNSDIGIATHTGKGAEEYVDMAVVLGRTLLDHAPFFPRLCLVRPDMVLEVRKRLSDAGWMVVPTSSTLLHDDSAEVDLYDQAELFRIKMKRLIYVQPNVIILNSGFRKGLRKLEVRAGHIAVGPGMMIFRPDLLMYRAVTSMNLNDNLLKLYNGRIDNVDKEWLMPTSEATCSETGSAHFTGPERPTKPKVKALLALREGLADAEVGMHCKSVQRRYFMVMRRSSLFLSRPLQEELIQADGILLWSLERHERQSRDLPAPEHRAQAFVQLGGSWLVSRQALVLAGLVSVLLGNVVFACCVRYQSRNKFRGDEGNLDVHGAREADARGPADHEGLASSCIPLSKVDIDSSPARAMRAGSRRATWPFLSSWR